MSTKTNVRLYFHACRTSRPSLRVRSTLFLALCPRPALVPQCEKPSFRYKIIGLYVLMFTAFGSRREGWRFYSEWQQAFSTWICFSFLRKCNSDFLVSFWNILSCHIFKVFITFRYFAFRSVAFTTIRTSLLAINRGSAILFIMFLFYSIRCLHRQESDVSH